MLSHILALFFLLACLWPTPGHAQVTLEAPNEGQNLTGIGLVRGWACEAQNVTVTVNNGPPIPTATGNPRGDTRAICGRSDTGFSLLLNWNEYGPGKHTLRLFTDGDLAATRTVEVVTFGEPFRDDLDGEWTFTDWPEVGTDTTVAWNEATQNIEIVDIHRPELPPDTHGLTNLLGNWFLEEIDGPHSFLFTLTDIVEVGSREEEHESTTEQNVTGIFPLGRNDIPVYGRTNTRRWFENQPLRQYEVWWVLHYRRGGSSVPFCHVFVFDLDDAAGVARGYYWRGHGGWPEMCRESYDDYGPRDRYGPVPARATRGSR